jgi:Ni,Fe-hydrogenase III small subunit
VRRHPLRRAEQSAVPESAAGPDAELAAAETQLAAAETLRRRVAAQFGRSLHIRTLDTGSCAACEQEIRMLAAPHYDLHRLGFFFTPAPRHADLLLVTGPMLRAFAAAARKTYDAMPDPKLVVASGACALGGVFQPDAFCHGSVDEQLPVDVWIPGCPPSPLALLQGLLVAVDRLAVKVDRLSFTAEGQR